MSDDFKKALHWQLQEGMVKVALELEGGPMRVEWLWCEPIDDRLLRVRNTPFFTPVVCLDDVIEVEPMGGDYEDYCYSLTKVVEHVREPVYFQYGIEGIGRVELNKRFSTFCNACREHDYVPEGAVAGYVVVAVPWGKAEDAVPVILGCAETAGLDMEVMLEEDDG